MVFICSAVFGDSSVYGKMEGVQIQSPWGTLSGTFVRSGPTDRD